MSVNKFRRMLKLMIANCTFQSNENQNPANALQDANLDKLIVHQTLREVIQKWKEQEKITKNKQNQRNLLNKWIDSEKFRYDIG